MQFFGFGRENPFFQGFETDPLGRRANFQARFAGFTPGQQEQLGGLFEPTFNRYLGMLGQQVMGGGQPTLSYTDYLNTSFNPQRELARFPQYSRRGFGGPAGFFFGR